MLCRENFARKPTLERLTVLTLAYKLSSNSVWLHLHIDFTVTVSKFCTVISAGFLKPAIRKDRGEGGI